EVPDEVIIRRISGRLFCPGCSANYHQESLRPKKEGVCDSCGGRLEVRGDDRPEVVAKRLKVYREQTAPVIDFYEKQSKLTRINGNQPPEKISSELASILQNAWPAAQKVDG